MDLNARGARAGVALRDRLERLAVPEPRALIDWRRGQRRRRTVAAVGVVIVMVAGVALLLGRSSSTQSVRVADSSGASGAWSSVPIQGSGLPAGASFSSLVTVDGVAYAAGAQPLGSGWGAAIWRSTDGLHWEATTHPVVEGTINVVAGRDGELLAAGSKEADRGAAGAFVWRSVDGGVTWTPLTGQDAFGVPAPSMGRPFVSSLRWFERAGLWLAGGGAADGYAGIWHSPDGVTWTPVLLTGNRAGGVDFADDGRGGVLAYWTTLAWSTTDGVTWAPMTMSVPPGRYVMSVVDGELTAVGSSFDSHETPTLLLRSEDGGATWVDDIGFLDRFPDAVAFAVHRIAGRLVVTGFAGSPNHPDAWISSPDGTSWDRLPTSLAGGPGGTLSFATGVDGRILLFSGAPEMDHYYVFEPS